MSSAAAATITDLVAARDWSALAALPDLLDSEPDGWSALQALAAADEGRGLWLDKLRTIQAWSSKEILIRDPDAALARPPPGDGMSDDRALVHGFAGRFTDNWKLLCERLKSNQLDGATRMLAVWCSLDGRILDSQIASPALEQAAADLLVSVALEFLDDDRHRRGLLLIGESVGWDSGHANSLAEYLYLDLCARRHFGPADRLLQAIPPAMRLSAFAMLARPPRPVVFDRALNRLPVSARGRSAVLDRFLSNQFALCLSSPPHPSGLVSANRFFNVFDDDNQRTPLCQHLLLRADFVRELFRRGSANITETGCQYADLRSDVLDRLDDDTLLAGPLAWPNHPDLQVRLDRARLRRSSSSSSKTTTGGRLL